MTLRASIAERLGRSLGTNGGADPSVYATPEMVSLREGAYSLCADPECELSGGYAHAGNCVPCTCGAEHAEAECPEREGR